MCTLEQVNQKKELTRIDSMYVDLNKLCIDELDGFKFVGNKNINYDFAFAPRRFEYPWALQAITPDQIVCDIGPGPIHPFVYSVARICKKTYALDNSDEVIHAVKKKAQEKGLNIDIRKWDLTSDTVYDDIQCDVITCIGILEHISADLRLKAIRNLTKMLKDKGLLLIAFGTPPLDPKEFIHDVLTNINLRLDGKISYDDTNALVVWPGSKAQHKNFVVAFRKEEPMINIIRDSRITGNALEPWLTRDAITFLDSYLTTDMIVAEYGSGTSTKWFADRVKYLVSVEHDIKWYNIVKSYLQKNNINNVVLIYAPINNDFEIFHYSSLLKVFPDSYFDFILIDGRHRVKCIANSINKVKPEGVIMLDDADRSYYKEGKDLLSLIGKITISKNGHKETAWWIKK